MILLHTLQPKVWGNYCSVEVKIILSYSLLRGLRQSYFGLIFAAPWSKVLRRRFKRRDTHDQRKKASEAEADVAG